MSKVPLHRLDIITGMDRGNCVAVAKIMEASLGHTDRCDNALVAVIHIVRRNMTAQLVRKDKAAVFPRAARTDLLCALLRLMLFQQRDDKRCSSDAAAFSVLRGNKPILPRLSGNVLQLFINENRAFFQIDTIPL